MTNNIKHYLVIDKISENWTLLSSSNISHVESFVRKQGVTCFVIQCLTDFELLVLLYSDYFLRGIPYVKEK